MEEIKSDVVNVAENPSSPPPPIDPKPVVKQRVIARPGKNLITGFLAFLILGVILGIVYTRSQTKKSEQLSENVIVTPSVPIVPTTKSPENPIASASSTPTISLNQISIEDSIPLTITTPLSDAVLSTSSVTVRGKTVAKAEVFINDSEIIADGNGNYSVTIKLDEGTNLIIVTSNDSEGNAAEKEITVTYDPGE